MNSMAQELVIRVYRGTNAPVENLQAHIQTIMKGVRNAMRDGITMDEWSRLIGRACANEKVSYHTCHWFVSGQGCNRDRACNHIHAQTSMDKGKGKDKDKGKTLDWYWGD